MHIIFRGFDVLISFRVRYSLGSMGGVNFKNKNNKQTKKQNQSTKKPKSNKKSPKNQQTKTPNNNKKAHTLTIPIFLQNLWLDEDKEEKILLGEKKRTKCTGAVWNLSVKKAVLRLHGHLRSEKYLLWTLQKPHCKNKGQLMLFNVWLYETFVSKTLIIQ